ncbi:3',5'-cyclic AMP phosphodiesterase CpdA [Fictibacillus enclensis]|uniref:Calcineurin-like phosphoesterase domain-containing protein n=2 Tax=Fictibacillus enclensis TaxID=1017270 RepID=A0A0V8JFL6_9BACL|nr:hypothetical protein AS030_10435 [Fictibacillus enclensis]SCC04339.1 3',5'-cyclic AMP phosphodiesterase CpdA [Fictibacillus enclensis]
MKIWKTIIGIITIASVAFPVTQAHALTSMDKQDGGIGNTTHYMEKNPDIAADPKVKNIIYPLMATPAIKKKGSALTIQVDTKGKDPSGWNVKLNENSNSKVEGEYSLPVTKAEKGSSYWKNSSSIYNVTVSIPNDVTEKLYDLDVSYTADGAQVKDEEPNSVKVVNDFKKDFRFIHLTDIHVGSPRNIQDPANATEAGMWNPDESKRWLYLQKTIKEVNLLKPDFVVLTGDLMFGQMNPKEYIYEYEETYRMLKKFDVPVYIIPGNHDFYAQDATLTDGAKYWGEYFGPEYYSFNYGPYCHMVGANSMDWDKFDRQGHGSLSVPTWGGQIRQAQMNWIKKDLEQNDQTANANQVKGLFSHNNPVKRDREIWPSSDPDVQEYWKEYDAQHNPQNLSTLLKAEELGQKYDQLWHGEGAQELVDVMKQHGVSFSLHGHTHTDNITQQNGILYTTTASIELSATPWEGYRTFQKDPDSKNFNSYIYEGTDRSIPVYENGNSAAGTVSFEANLAQPNDGTQGAQTATVTNRLKKEVTITVPLYMKPGTYKATDGEITENKLYGTKQWMELKVTVPANSTKEIKIQP